MISSFLSPRGESGHLEIVDLSGVSHMTLQKASLDAPRPQRSMGGAADFLNRPSHEMPVLTALCLSVSAPSNDVLDDAPHLR